MILIIERRRRRGRGPRYKTVVTYHCEHCGRTLEARWTPARSYRYCSRFCTVSAQLHTWVTQTPTNRSVQIAEQYERDPHWGALTTLAHEHGITRERVRQIVARQRELRRLPRHSEPKEEG